MQIGQSSKGLAITGYGVVDFDPSAITNGVITDPAGIAKVLKKLFETGLEGDITARRVALSIPASRSYTRTMIAPNMTEKDLADAVKLEAEQYIPVPIDDLYLDHSVLRKNKAQTELLVVASPKKIIDSYMRLAAILGIEVVAIEPSSSSITRLFTQSEIHDVPTVLIDFGSISSDIIIYDQVLIVTGAVPSGGNNFTDLISRYLGVTYQEATIIKLKYGLAVSKRQKEIKTGLQPVLDAIIKEVRHTIRYYEERTKGGKKIEQIITTGGGANMPGLAEYMTDTIRVAVRSSDPWQHMTPNKVKPPKTSDRQLYATVAGLALIDPRIIL